MYAIFVYLRERFYDMAYVYCHKRKDINQFFYIGIGSDNSYKRANEKTRRSIFWKRITDKYEYEVIILYDNISFAECKNLEIELIKKYGRIDIGTGVLCNLTDGGDGTKNKIFTEEYRKKLSISAKKRDNSEAYKRMMAGRKLYKITEEHREKIRASSRNRIVSEKAKNSARKRMLTNNPSKNKLGKDSINYKFDIIALKDNKEILFHGVHEAARKLNLSATKISAVLNGRRNHTGGYKFIKIL